MLARFHETERGIYSRHPRSKGKPETSAFQSGHVAFNRRARRILRACVLVAFVLADAFLNVCRSLINRDRYCARGGVRFLPRMDSIRFKTRKLVTRRGSLLDSRERCEAWFRPAGR